MTPLREEEVRRRLEEGESLSGCDIAASSLKGLTVTHPVDCRSAVFHGDISFRDTTFLASVDFSKASFLGRCDFARVNFAQDVLFEDTTFRQHTTFGNAHFQSSVSFERSVFHDVTYFGYMSFGPQAEFTLNYAKFRNDSGKRVYFDGSAEKRLFSKVKVVRMVSVEFDYPPNVFFRNVDLGHCYLTNTLLAGVQLTGIVWPLKQRWIWRRLVVYDEVGPEQGDKRLIEELYRQLKLNYERKGSYGEASDFHYGEMEMRRQQQKLVARHLSMTALYKYLSGYGERYWRALAGLGVLLAGSAAAYFITGLESLTEPARDVDYWDSLMHSFRIALLQSDTGYRVMSRGGGFIEIAETILIPLQAALSVLALRRRFKR